MNGPLTLRFTEWRCGHHGQRPADIPVQSVQQAQLILQAIANAISQPGHARAVLFDANTGRTAYVTDDYAEPLPEASSYRTVVYHGSPTEIADLEGLQDAFDAAYGGTLRRWDGAAWLDDMEVMTTLSAAEIEVATAPVEWHEEDQRHPVCDLPPVLKPAAELLAELREVKADMEAEAAELAQDGTVLRRPSVLAASSGGEVRP
ncbi:hypothetical protein [Xenophilus azovorans]|uniref:hypothetical protein n=1 Tax=Xenophilus azovorans TaxID=151755 RepID=UPI00056E3D31|nr:hypothetical protein [Xenophilus azovorans]